ncbi:MAG: hypothetical protein IPG96_11425 [Proteobacteria bacterium]|nr:hypothetical protein [Pseudomonadota bacterium]
MASRRGGLRRAARIAALGLAGALVLVVVLVFVALRYARSSGGRERLRGWVVDLVRQRLPGFQLGAIRGDYLGSLVLEDLTLRDRHGGEAIQIAAVRLHYDLTGLLRHHLRIEALVLERPRVVLRGVRGSGSNLGQLALPPPAHAAARKAEAWEWPEWTVELKQLRIDHGSFVDQRAASGVSVHGLSLRAAARLNQGELELRIDQLRARVRLAGPREWEVALKAPLRLRRGKRLDGHLSVQIAGLPAGLARIELVVAGALDHLRLNTQANLGPAGSLGLEGWVDVLSERARYQLGLSLHQLRPAMLVAGLPELRLDLRADARGAGVPLQPNSVLALRLELARGEVMGLAVDRCTLVGRLSGSRWVVERLDLRSRGLRAHATGRGTLERIEAELQANVPDLSRLPLPGKALDLAGALQLHAKVSGRFGGELTADLGGSLRGLRLANARVAHLELGAKLGGLPTQPHGRLTLTARALRWADPPLHLDHLRATVEGRRREGRADLVARGLLGGSAAVHAAWRDHGSQQARLVATVDGLQPAKWPRLSARLVAVAQRRWIQASLIARLPGTASRLQVEAALPITFTPGAFVPVLAARRSARVEAQLAALDLHLLRRLGLSTAPVGGRLGLRARLEGPLTGPRLNAEVELQDGRFAAFAGVKARAAVTLDDRLSLEVDATQGGSRLLHLRGDLELASTDALKLGVDPLGRLGHAPLQLRLESGRVALQQLAKLDPSLARLGGHARLVLSAGGQLFRPRGDLELLLERGRLDRLQLGDLRLAVQLRSAPTTASTAATLLLERGGRALLRGRGSLARSVEALNSTLHRPRCEDFLATTGGWPRSRAARSPAG